MKIKYAARKRCGVITAANDDHLYHLPSVPSTRRRRRQKRYGRCRGSCLLREMRAQCAAGMQIAKDSKEKKNLRQKHEHQHQKMNMYPPTARPPAQDCKNARTSWLDRPHATPCTGHLPLYCSKYTAKISTQKIQKIIILAKRYVPKMYRIKEK